MGRLHHLAAAVAMGAVLTVGPGPSDPTAANAPTVTMTGITAAQATIFEWALALFAAADLPLPDIDIVGHDSTAPCMGRNGMHTFADGRSTIHVCTRDAGPVQEFLFLHELAHAWDRAGLTAERRQAFLAQRGLTEWRNDDPERWHDRGAEHAAEIIMWGLIDRPIRRRPPLGHRLRRAPRRLRDPRRPAALARIHEPLPERDLTLAGEARDCLSSTWKERIDGASAGLDHSAALGATTQQGPETASSTAPPALVGPRSKCRVPRRSCSDREHYP